MHSIRPANVSKEPYKYSVCVPEERAECTDGAYGMRGDSARALSDPLRAGLDEGPHPYHEVVSVRRVRRVVARRHVERERRQRARTHAREAQPQDAVEQVVRGPATRLHHLCLELTRRACTCSKPTMTHEPVMYRYEYYRSKTYSYVLDSYVYSYNIV